MEDEWPAMREPRGHSERVDHWSDHFSDDFHRLVELRSGRERLGFEELLQEARERTAGRSDRLAQAAPSVPAPLWFVLILGGCVTVLIQLAMADPRERLRIQGAMIAGVAAIVAAGLLLVDFLDHPYAGRTGGVEPIEMQDALAMMQEQQPGLQVPCDTAGRPVAE